MYDFWRGHPNRNDLPVDDVRSVLREMIVVGEDDDDDDDDGRRRNDGDGGGNDREEEEEEGEEALRDCLGYGPCEGDERLRSSLSSFLDRRTSDDDVVGEKNDDDDDCDDGKKTTTNEEVDRAANRRLFVTNGVSHGLELLCATRTEPGDVVLVERPTYFLAADIFRSRGLILKPLPMILPEGEEDVDGGGGGGGGGVDVDRLSELVETGVLDPPEMIYVVPCHQNPTGRTMTVEARRKLARFALEHGTLVAADEVYHLLDWSVSGEGGEEDDGDNGGEGTTRRRRRPARMASFDRSERLRRRRRRRSRRSTAAEEDDDDSTTSDGAGGEANGGGDGDVVPGARRRDDDNHRRRRKREGGCCVSVSSFTKIFAPGVRCGWIEGPEFVVKDLIRHGYIQSQGGCAPFVGQMMRRLIDSGSLDARLDRLCSSYRRRSRILCDALSVEPRIRVAVRPSGGYFLWIRFPRDVVNSERLLRFCAEEKYGVKFMPGVRCDPFRDDDDDDSDGETRTTIDDVGDEGAGMERPFESCARLCFADMDEEDLEEGARHLVAAFRDFVSVAGRRET